MSVMAQAEYWEHFAHGADIGVRGIAATETGAFVQAAVALTAVITNPESVAATLAVSVHCEAPDHELLFAEWLNALIYEMATRNMLFSRFELRLDATSLDATLWGEPIDVPRHTPVVEVKGATYTELQVVQQADGKWLAQCVVDV